MLREATVAAGAIVFALVLVSTLVFAGALSRGRGSREVFSAGLTPLPTPPREALIDEYVARALHQGSPTSHSVMRCPIWIFWEPGWEHAPQLVRAAAATFVHHNAPEDCAVYLIARRDLEALLPRVERQRLYDASLGERWISLALLSHWGGVWVSPGVVCMAPVASWIYDALYPTGYWAYPRPGGTRIVASTQQSYILTTLYRGINQGELQRLRGDARFAREWASTPPYPASSSLEGELVVALPPDDAGATRSHAAKVLDLSLSRPAALPGGPFATPDALGRDRAFSWSPPRRAFSAPLRAPVPWTASSRALVVADCNHADSIKTARDLCLLYSYVQVVYDKCNFCNHVPRDTYCRPLRNVGRESETFLRFIVAFYDRLPDVIIFLAGNLDKYSRRQRLEALMSDSSDESKCTQAQVPGDFQLTDYDGTRLLPATVRPFGPWHEENVSQGNPPGSVGGPCWNLIFKTTSKRLRKRRKDFYENLHAQVSTHNAPEAGHYIERSALDIFW